MAGEATLAVAALLLLSADLHLARRVARAGPLAPEAGLWLVDELRGPKHPGSVRRSQMAGGPTGHHWSAPYLDTFFALSSARAFPGQRRRAWQREPVLEGTQKRPVFPAGAGFVATFQGEIARPIQSRRMVAAGSSRGLDSAKKMGGARPTGRRRTEGFGVSGPLRFSDRHYSVAAGKTGRGAGHFPLPGQPYAGTQTRLSASRRFSPAVSAARFAQRPAQGSPLWIERRRLQPTARTSSGSAPAKNKGSPGAQSCLESTPAKTPSAALSLLSAGPPDLAEPRPAPKKDPAMNRFPNLLPGKKASPGALWRLGPGPGFYPKRISGKIFGGHPPDWVDDCVLAGLDLPLLRPSLRPQIAPKTD